MYEGISCLLFAVKKKTNERRFADHSSFVFTGQMLKLNELVSLS